jgi:hypothetical protein
VSPIVTGETWDALAAVRGESRHRAVEGLMLKRLTSAYGVGRKRGDWWKWKIDPHTIDAVLIYAQPGSGKRASLLTDYTFGLWSAGELVPVAKAYSGLSNDEITEMDRWIRRHTVERFGPVRHVEPVHVFELGFEAIAPSSRHRSGVAVRFPRMLRWRNDKPASEADTLDVLKDSYADIVNAQTSATGPHGASAEQSGTYTVTVCPQRDRNPTAVGSGTRPSHLRDPGREHIDIGHVHACRGRRRGGRSRGTCGRGIRTGAQFA